jgi:hypothetical protein
MILVDANLLIYSADNDFKRFAGVRHINPLADGPR